MLYSAKSKTSPNKQTLKAVNDSRAKLVGDIIYPNINEEKFSVLFSDKGSRPNIGIRKYISFLILTRMYRMSMANGLEFLRCGAMNFQYALHTTQEEEQPLSERTLARFRRKLEKYNKENNCDLLKEEFERISKIMAVNMGVLPDPETPEDARQTVLMRMDSMEVEAHAKVMTRLELLYMTNVVLIRRLIKDEMDEIIPKQLAHYIEKDDHNKTLYYRISDADEKAKEQGRRISTVVEEMAMMYDILHLNFSEQILRTVPEYRLFNRVYGEQVVRDENGARIPRDKHEIPADSVQNPFDETVTYRKKRGDHHGSVLNVAEAHDGQGNGVIVYADVAPNTTSDNELEKKVIERMPENENGGSVELQTDGAYGSEELSVIEKEKNVTRKSTSLTGKKADGLFALFTLSDDKKSILSCPDGKRPEKCTYNEKSGAIRAYMPCGCCASCPHKDICRASIGKKSNKGTITIKVATVRRAELARKLESGEYKTAACQRNGVEGIMSVMRRKYGLDQIPVFGLERSKTWIWCSLFSYNAVKYKKYQDSKTKAA